MNRDDDINVPNMGPAEPAGDNRHAPVGHQAHNTPRQSSNVEPVRPGGGFIQPLVSIILIVAVSALGYFGFDMYQAQKEREATFTQAQEQISQLKGLLQEAEQGAEKSGEALKGNVSSLEASLRQKDKQLDSEIAKLWAIAHQKNAPLIEKQAKALAVQNKQLAAQKKLIKSLQSTQESQAKTIKGLASVKANSDKLKKTLTAEMAKVSKLVSRIETEMRTEAELAQDQQDEMLKSQRALSDRVVKLEGKSSAGLERRIKVNEQAVRAFDGTRRQLNQDLLQVKQKLNNMQLLLEQK